MSAFALRKFRERLTRRQQLTDSPTTPAWKGRVVVTVNKFDGEWSGDEIAAGLAAQSFVDSVTREGNGLSIGGVSALWQRLIGTGVTAYGNATATIGVGDSSTTFADTQTDLQASSNKTYKGMDSTYPLHTDSTSSSGAKTITFRATFGTSDANYAWNEWAVGNGTTTIGRMLNRKVESLGTKPNTQTWQFTITIALA